MKKKIFVFVTFVAFLSLIVFACKKENDSLTVGYSYESGTGANPDNTSAGSTSAGTTTSTSMGSTSTTGGGSTTSTPTGNYFKVNSTVYNCTSVFGGTWNNSWSIIGRSASGDSCSVSFTAIPAAGSYPHTAALTPSAGECLVAVNIGNSTTVYLGDVGSAVITVPSVTSRKVSISGMTILNLNNGSTATLTASMTTP